MFKYIYTRPGNRQESMSQKSMATMLVADGVPQWAAIRLVEMAESRCRMKHQLAQKSGSDLDQFEATINAELHVQYFPEKVEVSHSRQTRLI